MSASLVGSEMCIRDSARTAAMTAQPDCFLITGICSRDQKGGGQTSGWTSVSYTHLTLPTICSV
eukprot:14088046-Alexandrium_andersonii.AAC.1